MSQSLHYRSEENECDFFNTTSQLPQSDRRLGSSWPAHCLDPQCPQVFAPPLQASSPAPSSIYTPDRTQQDSASPQSQSLQQYTLSQTPNQYILPSSYFEANTPSVHSHQRHGGGGTATSFRGSEISRSGHDWPIYNGDGTPVTSMDTSGPRIVQGSSIELYNPGAEQSNEQRLNVLSEMGSWGSPRVPGGANVLGNYHRSDGTRCPLNRRSASDQCEGLTVNPSQIWNSVPMENNPARQDQGTHSQEIGCPFDPSALGIDQSLQPPYFSEVHGSFVEDANNTNTDACDSQNEEHPHNLGYPGNHCPSKSSALAPNCVPVSRNMLSSIVPNMTPHFDQGAQSQLAPESSEKCQTCRKAFSNSDNRRRHTREIHSLEPHTEKVQYKCRLIKNGSVCSANIKDARNRRKHVETSHRQESMELPPTSKNHRRNDKTDEILNGWFDTTQQ